MIKLSNMTTWEADASKSDDFWPPSDEIDWEAIGAWGDVGALDLTPKLPPVEELSLAQRLVEARPNLKPNAAVEAILASLQFEEHHKGLIMGHDPVGLIRRLPDGRIEDYLEKQILERGKGKLESGAWGIAKIGGQPASVFAMNWRYMGGSLGVVAGEKFQLAADLAKGENLPFIGIFASGGVRQQENFSGLVQMERMVNAVRNFRTMRRPYIGILVGQVWGGVSASAVPLADLTVALAGTNYGFSGPRVIETYEGKAVPPGMQSAENNLLDRNIDMMVSDEAELTKFLGDFIKTTKKPPKKRLTLDNLPQLRIIGERGRAIALGKSGVNAALYEQQKAEISLEIPSAALTPGLSKEDELMRTYENFIRSPACLDSEFVIANVFSQAVPLYNHYVDQNKKSYPAIIAAVGKIGPQPFLIIGNQPSYQVSAERVRRIPSTPAPKDFEYARRMLALGRRLELPVVFLTDTLGAEPTMDAEEKGQSRSIANMIYDANDYSQPVLSLVLNALGSGGGLATAPRGDWRGMMQSAMAFVAEPRSASAILYGEANPNPEDVKLTLGSMSATAEDQLRMGLIDQIVSEADSPYRAAENIHEAIARAYVEVSDKRFLRRRRSARIRAMGRRALAPLKLNT